MNFAINEKRSRPRIQHIAIPIPQGSQEKVREFYGGVLGFTEKRVPKSIGHLGLVWFYAGDDELELHFQIRFEYYETTGWLGVLEREDGAPLNALETSSERAATSVAGRPFRITRCVRGVRFATRR